MVCGCAQAEVTPEPTEEALQGQEEATPNEEAKAETATQAEPETAVNGDVEMGDQAEEEVFIALDSDAPAVVAEEPSTTPAAEADTQVQQQGRLPVAISVLISQPWTCLLGPCWQPVLGLNEAAWLVAVGLVHSICF